MNKKTITYYARESYGARYEYIHPDFSAEARYVEQLTGKKTVTANIREMISTLAPAIFWQEVMAPVK